MLISDVDGVWTDGTFYKGPDGFELKKFSVLDGAAVALLRQVKIPLCLISGRRSEATSERAKELKINDVYNGVLNKIKPYEELKEKYNAEDSEIMYIGDDLIDIPIMKKVAFPVSVSNATQEVKDIRDSVGGDEAYGKMVSWALENLPKPEIEAFNEATNTMSGPQLGMMVQGLYTRYQNAMGVEPSLYSGRPASSGPTPYRSTQEVVAAMSDPRYGKDVTYTEDVQRRLGGSDVFG